MKNDMHIIQLDHGPVSLMRYDDGDYGMILPYGLSKSATFVGNARDLEKLIHMATEVLARLPELEEAIYPKDVPGEIPQFEGTKAALDSL